MARQGARRRDGAAAPLFPRVASVAGVVFADDASCDRRCRPQRAVTQGKRGGELSASRETRASSAGSNESAIAEALVELEREAEHAEEQPTV